MSLQKQPSSVSLRTRRELNLGLLLLALFVFASTAAVADQPSGTWTKKSFKVEGTWSIVEEGGKRFVVLDDDFKTRNAPDLKIFLSPTRVEDVGNKNATKGSVLVGELPKVKGSLRLEIPSDVDLSQYTSLLLHCERYTKLWAAAPLR